MFKMLLEFDGHKRCVTLETINAAYDYQRRYYISTTGNIWKDRHGNEWTCIREWVE